MADRLLLDTNAASAVMRMQPAAIELIADAEAVYLPCVALGELFYGALHAAAVPTQLARVQELESGSEVVSADSGSALIYGRIKADLRSKGRMIPDNDLWIAAIALQHGLTVVTQDAHFREIEEVDVAGW
jgi:tRNA(fMet)-specific endonuclease VapC